MCGIVYYKSFIKEDVTANVISRYYQQRTRGTEGFGFYLPQIDRLTHNTHENRILELLRSSEASEILYHHRMPTSTSNVHNSCHPFSTGRFFKHNYVMAHNGIIYNDFELSEDHSSQGIQYISAQVDGKFNDSEALLYDVALYLEGRQSQLNVKGSVAFVTIENDNRNRPLNLHFARNESSPLYLEFTPEGLNLASETRLESDATMIMPNYLYTLNYRTKKLTVKPLKISEYPYAAQSLAQTYDGYSDPWKPESQYETHEAYKTKKFNRKDKKIKEVYDAETDSWVKPNHRITLEYFETMSLKLTDKFIDQSKGIFGAISAMQETLDSNAGKLSRLNRSFLSAQEIIDKRRLKISQRMINIGLTYLDSIVSDQTVLEPEPLLLKGV